MVNAVQQARELAAMLMLLNEGVRVASRRRLSTRAQLDPIVTTFRMLREQMAPPGQRPEGSVHPWSSP
jgi:hypothetical protein